MNKWLFLTLLIALVFLILLILPTQILNGITNLINKDIERFVQTISAFFNETKRSDIFNQFNAPGSETSLIFIAISTLIILLALGAIISFARILIRIAFKLLKIPYGEDRSKEKKKISTIMFIDMKGFSSEVEKDEATTLKRLWRYEGIMKDIIKRHNGRVVKTIGDAIMSDFESTLNAVKSAMVIQSILTHDHFRVKIGIHIDEVVHKAGDVYGGGVNIASRIESIAEGGTIYVSENVYDEVKDRVNAEFEDLGLKQLRNIQRQIRIYKIVPIDRQDRQKFELSTSELLFKQHITLNPNKKQ